MTPPKDIRNAVMGNGGRIDRMLTRYDPEREGRVVELTAFFPGTSGYDQAADAAEDEK